MASVNKVILVGNCGRDPEIRYLPSGQAVANVSVATSSRRKDKNSGEMVEDTQWHRVTFYDRLAEIAGEYVKKGRPIYVEGRLTYRKYTDKDGIEKFATEIRGETAVNIGNRRLPRSMQRQALTIVSLTTFVIIGSVMLLRLTTNFDLDQILFEVVSATGTVGLSTGITASLPDHAKFLLSLLMLFGRLGPIVVATSLAMRRTRRHFEYPKERPLIG